MRAPVADVTRDEPLRPDATNAGSLYPFMGDTPFVYNAWYVSAWASELVDMPIARTLLDRSIVLYRRTDGSPVALLNRCPHRGLPLAMGRVCGDDIACGYHGFVFDPLGRCRQIPSQERVPPAIAVRHFPAVERWQWIWVWMGEPELADETLIPDTSELGFGGPPWPVGARDDFHVRARYQLFNENLLDQTHLSFLHRETIGSPELLSSSMKVEVEGRRVRLTRETFDEQMAPFYARRFGVPAGRMDRRYTLTFIAPSFHIIHTRVSEAGTGSRPEPVIYGEHKVLHAITPQTRTTLHDFWAVTRSSETSEEMSVLTREQINQVIRQDIVALEAIESSIEIESVEYSCAADVAALKARHLVQELLNAEKHGKDHRIVDSGT